MGKHHPDVGKHHPRCGQASPRCFRSLGGPAASPTAPGTSVLTNRRQPGAGPRPSGQGKVFWGRQQHPCGRGVPSVPAIGHPGARHQSWAPRYPRGCPGSRGAGGSRSIPARATPHAEPGPRLTGGCACPKQPWADSRLRPPECTPCLGWHHRTSSVAAPGWAPAPTPALTPAPNRPGPCARTHHQGHTLLYTSAIGTEYVPAIATKHQRAGYIC